MGTSMKDLMGGVYRRLPADTDASCGSTASESARLRASMKRMPDASCSGKITGRCGETMEITLDIEGERITDAGFFTDGCGYSILCGSLATQLARGKTIDEAVEIGGDTILMVMEEVPAEDSHCAFLAAEALHAAIHDWMLKWNTVPLSEREAVPGDRKQGGKCGGGGSPGK